MLDDCSEAVRRKDTDLLHLILFLSMDYLLCSKISKLFLYKKREDYPCWHLPFLFLKFSESSGFYLTATASIVND
jgi:hypothetical protein